MAYMYKYSFDTKSAPKKDRQDTIFANMVFVLASFPNGLNRTFLIDVLMSQGFAFYEISQALSDFVEKGSVIYTTSDMITTPHRPYHERR